MPGASRRSVARPARRSHPGKAMMRSLALAAGHPVRPAFAAARAGDFADRRHPRLLARRRLLRLRGVRRPGRLGLRLFQHLPDRHRPGCLGQRHADPRHARERGRDARRRPRGGAAAVRAWLDRYGIAPAGRTVVSNPSSELSADPYSVRFLTDLYANWRDHAWTLKLTPIPLPEPIACENLGPVEGFRLVLANWPDRSDADAPRRQDAARLARLRRRTTRSPTSSPISRRAPIRSWWC